jgi:hypothetical protein
MNATWTLILAAAALAALSLWQTFARAKNDSDLMLKQYQHMLAEARRARAEARGKAADEVE